MSKRTKKKLTSKRAAKTSSPRDKLPLIEHLKELRRRLTIVAVSIVAGSMAAYGVQQQIIDVLLRPSNGQDFIYTSPLGGINFLFSVCLDIGIAVSIPLIIYQVLRFLQPLMRATATRFIFIGSLLSGLVAIAGILFGYFIGLPAALHFLLHQFTSVQIKPLVTIQSYMSFVTVYLLGCALMFQLPLLLLFINRIKPLKPSKLFHYERHVIVFAFVAGFIMNPTPNVLDQMIVVVPIILMYQVGIGLIWFVNWRRSSKRHKFAALFEQDARLRAIRADNRVSAAQHFAEDLLDSSAAVLHLPGRPVLAPALADDAPQEEPQPTAPPPEETAVANEPAAEALHFKHDAVPKPAAAAGRSQRYVDGFAPVRRIRRTDYQQISSAPHRKQRLDS